MKIEKGMKMKRKKEYMEVWICPRCKRKSFYKIELLMGLPLVASNTLCGGCGLDRFSTPFYDIMRGRLPSAPAGGRRKMKKIKGTAWKNISGDNNKLDIPIMKDTLIPLLNAFEKKIVITNEVITNGMAEVEEKKKIAEKETEIKAQQIKIEREKEEKERKIRKEEERKREEKKEKEEKERKGKIADEKKQWIEKNGSERLKLAIAEGYEAKKQYIMERAIQELGENARIDYEEKGEWNKRSCPSLEAIKLERELKGKGYEAGTVWGFLCNCNEKYCECEKHEMVIVKNFLDICDVVVAEF